MNARTGWIRVVGLGSAAWGAALLARGPQLWRRLLGNRPTNSERRAITFLGARHAVQGTLQAVAPARLHGLWVLVDLAHAASMIAAAAADRDRRKAELLTGGVALLSAVLTSMPRRLESPS